MATAMVGDDVVRSLTNPLVKRLVRLRERRARQREGVVLVEGAREVGRAVAAGWPLELLAWCPERLSPEARDLWDGLAEHAAERRRFAPDAFDKVSLRAGPDGVAAVVRPRWHALDQVDWAGAGLYLVVVGLEKPGNLGALLRTADAVGCRAVFVTGAGTDLGNPNVIRASMGSVFTVPAVVTDDATLRAALRDHGVAVIATSPRGERPYWSLPLAGRVALVLGPEHEGLDEAWLAGADGLATIPMRGVADSLNVATAGALLLYEALRQRSAGPAT